MDLKRHSKGDLNTNPLINKNTTISNEQEKQALHFRRNIKLPDEVFYRVKALQKVLPYKQYELIEKMTNLMVAELSESNQKFFSEQVEMIRELEEEKKQQKEGKKKGN